MANQRSDLVIVESPAKAKTIGKYLGPGYTVRASMGHLRDLPKSTLGVDIEHDFTPEYVPMADREDVIKDLKKNAKSSNRVYLATDPDREGEAISWHLKELLGLSDEKALRVTFNEITSKVVQESIRHPRQIDLNIVDAQQARRIIDRIVGYKLSPLLWKKVRRGLSAGRVQSVAVRLVVDRENEIRAFVPKEYWTLDAVLSPRGEDAQFMARFVGAEKKKMELHSEDEVRQVVAAVSSAPFSVADVKRGDKTRNPSPPFTTSTLQQEASRKLGMTPRRTMSVAQQLYEGVELEGEGAVGLITYMRTDSLRLSDEALDAAGRFIRDRYGSDYYPGKPRHYKTKSGAQDAHEAIRPSDAFRTPESLRSQLTAEQYRLYRLIWSRFIACQMSAAVYDSVTLDAVAAGYLFRANSTALKFAGYTAVYEEGRDEETAKSGVLLPQMAVGDPLDLKRMVQEQKFTQPPTRFTEATLVKEMEETGIGRPSTYAPTLSTIMDRNYVIKEGKFLRPTPLGEVVTQLMMDRFTDIVDPGFTAGMESRLDAVEKGEQDYKALLHEFYDPFAAALDRAEKALAGEHIRVPDEVSSEVCDVCGKPMVIKTGRFGRFLGCSGFPECTFTKPLVIEMPGRCPRCGSRILKRTSRTGHTFYACERLKECGFLTWDVPVAENCPSCGKTMFKHSGRGAKKPFCINENCPNFVPEDKRGGFRPKPKSDKAGGSEEKAAAMTASSAAKNSGTAKKNTEKKSAAKSGGAKKTASGASTAARKKSSPGSAGKRTTGSRTRKTAEKDGGTHA